MGLFDRLKSKKSSEKPQDIDYEQIFGEIKRNAVHMTFRRSSKVEPGVSKFGGEPDLPPDFKWPYFAAEYHDGTGLGAIGNRPLSFLLQINCAELGEFDLEEKLPKTGMLYFFYEMKTQVWGMDPKDKGSAVVTYFDGDLSLLEKRNFPADLAEEFRFPQHSVHFESEWEIPHYDEYAADGMRDDSDEYYETAARLGYRTAEEPALHKLLGYADIIQEEMLSGCQLASNGVSWVDFERNRTLRMDELLQDKGDWTLLAQMSSIETGTGFELLFGDSGTVYFYIKSKDLEQQDFSSTWLTLQCD